MRWLQMARLRFRALLKSTAADRDLDDELRDHLQYLIDDNIGAGLSPQGARDKAIRDFGGFAGLKEQCRDARGVGLVEDLVKDITYAWRLLLRAPGFALTAVCSLALGIGANTAIFSLVDTVLLRMLPVERPQELVFVHSAGTAGPSGSPPYPYFERLRSETSAFAGMAAFAADELRVDVDGSVEQVFGQVASGSYFDVVGVKPAAGRLMTPDDEKLDPPVAVIGYGYWQRRFGGSPNAIGRSVSFGDRIYTIVGITPPQFWGLQPGRQVEVTLPITQARGMLADSRAWWFDAVARLRPGVTVKQATDQADTVFQSFMNDHDRSGELRKTRFDHMELTAASQGLDRLRSRFSKPLYALTLIAVIVLLIACANLGNLLLVRGAARAHELAIRVATGASSGRLVRQLLTETLLLFLLGGAAGLVIAYVMIQTLTGFFAIGRNPILLDVQYDWRLAAFAVGVALVAGLLTGLWPALRVLRTSPQAAMKNSETRPGSRRLRATGRVLVASQVALSLVLLVTSVIFLKTMANLRAVNLGFSASRVLTMSLDPMMQGETTAEAREQFWARVLERVRGLSGVRAASLSVLTPLSGRDTGKRVSVAGFQPRSEMERSVHLNHVSEDYFQVFGIELCAGRAFTARDSKQAVKVVVVNETAARFYFAGRNPIGETIAFGDPGVRHQVVGVVRDYKHKSLREQAPRFAFVPLWQPLEGISRITLAVSSDEPASTVTRAVAQEVRAIHLDTLVSDVIGVEEQIDATLLSERLLSTLATAFAALALGLAAIGLYGVLSYAVARRRAEFGIRMALGASPSRVASGVIREVLLQVTAGIGIGLLAALAAARTAEGLLFGVRAADSANYLFSAALLTLVACLAAWVPVRRACAIDPSEALRRE